MKNKNLFLGIVLIFVGDIALLAALDVFEFRWSIVRHLWPVLLIIIGVMVLPVKDWIKALLLVVSLAIGVLLYRYESNREHPFWRFTEDIGQPKTELPYA